MRRKILTAALLGILISISSSGMTLSYLTDSDESISNFTVGRVSIKSIKTEENCQSILDDKACRQTISVLNTGNSPAYIRVRVLVPFMSRFDGIQVDLTETGNSYIQRTIQDRIGNEVYDIYDFYYEKYLDSTLKADPVIIKISSSAKATTETNNSESCMPEEGEESCEAEIENTSVNIKDVGIKIYTQAIQATGFNSVEEAFKNY